MAIYYFGALDTAYMGAFHVETCILMCILLLYSIESCEECTFCVM